MVWIWSNSSPNVVFDGHKMTAEVRIPRRGLSTAGGHTTKPSAREHRDADAGRAGADHRRGRCRDPRVPRGALDASCGASAYHYFYGEPMDTEASTAAWQKRLTDLFPAPEPGPNSP
jgi:hypothetical protein